MSGEINAVDVIKEKLAEFLGECTLGEANGITFSGEAWAYRRMLNFINGMQISSHTQSAAS